MYQTRQQLVRAVGLSAVVLLCVSALPSAAQVRCTMPNGVVITQQLGECPRDAVSAARLDGTPVQLKPGQSHAAAGQAAVAPPAPVAASKPLAASPSEPSDSLTLGGLTLLNWVVVGLLAWALVWAIKGSGGTSGPERYCTTCGHVGKGRTHTRGALAIEIVLWLCFLVPGLIYSLWRHSSKHKVCAVCAGAALVPLNSPVAQAARRARGNAEGSM